MQKPQKYLLHLRNLEPSRPSFSLELSIAMASRMSIETGTILGRITVENGLYCGVFKYVAARNLGLRSSLQYANLHGSFEVSLEIVFEIVFETVFEVLLNKQSALELVGV
jgi:hypothetical protein